MRLASLLALLIAVAPAAAAQDSDGDGVPNGLEQNGFRFDVTSGEAVACNPATDDPCYVTDPLAWSSDGDPYSDFQEASGVNMDATVDAPYNNPLVAAYPVIEVTLDSYTFTSNATITDARGAALTQGMSFSRNVEETASASVTVGGEYNVLTGPTYSAETTASYSYTESYGSEVTSGSEINWETATSTELDDAGTLDLRVFARNTGGATALDVLPTFTITIGNDLVATVTPGDVLALSLTPGQSSATVVLPGIQLSLQRLLALERGASVGIRVTDISANIQRWRPEDSNWACGSGETCTWTSFQNQIEPRTMRLLVDFGYSGDPAATVPARFRGNPFDYRVYAGSPSASGNNTLVDMLAAAGFDVSAAGAIEGRPYPSWILFEEPSPDPNFDPPVFDAWEAAGRPSSLLDVVMPREATLALSSHDPADAGAAIRAATTTSDLVHVRAIVAARGGIPIETAVAVLVQNGETRTVPLQPVFGRAYWSTEGAGVPTSPIGMASSYIEITDVSGAVRTSPLELPIEPAETCAEVRDEDLVDVFDGGGRTVIFPSGNLDGPVEVHCEPGTGTTRYWVPQSLATRPAHTLVDAVVLDDGTALAVGTPSGDRHPLIARSVDGGRTWTFNPAVRAGGMTAIVLRPDTQTLLAAGVEIVGGGDYLRSTDQGETWEALSGPALTQLTHGGGGTWFGATASALYTSTDDGRTFSALTLPEAPEEIVDVEFRSATVGMYIDTGNGSAGSGHIWRTLDGGATWQQAVRAHDDVAIAYAGDGTWYVTGGSPTVPNDDRTIRITDDGEAWENIRLSSLGAENLGRAAFLTPEIGYIPSRTGILQTADGGDTWSFEPAVPQTAPLAVLPFDADRAVVLGLDFRASVTGRGLVQITTSGGTGAVRLPNAVAEPGGGTGLALDPAAPNPFRQRTALTYRLDAPGEVELVVFDLLGREVARLVDGPRAAGEHTATWAPQGLASGVYVARLRVRDAVQTQTVTVVR